MNVARADTVDVELDRLISKRASQDRRPDPDEAEEIWKESVRRYNARRRDPKAPIRHIEVLHGFPPRGDVWEVVDGTESAAREGEGSAVIKVVYDDPPERESI